MKVQLFDYYLPESLIAQKPMTPRDSSRLLVVHSKEKKWEHQHFYNLIDYLQAGDVLVLNHTKVIPARLFGKKETGAIIEVLLLKKKEIDIWEVLVKPGKKVKIGDRIFFGENQELRTTCIDITEEGSRIIQFYYEGVFEVILDFLGEMPLPPYITETLKDSSRYQTVYSKDGVSVAAPTAGLHFTEELLVKIKEKGIMVTSLLLNVGLGTFRPVKEENLEDHPMHEEYYELSEESANIINKAKNMNQRVIAVGTTSVRVLETIFLKYGKAVSDKGWTNIFIYPGYQYKCIDGLITNFHLPKSTLLMLVSALIGREFTLATYEEAVKQGYRFFSFGDAMFIE
ncbi:S-adenosylmethionine:tRNA ribosyltransferase-isomerase [endosymbiont 'TC1' of Trimyema compressum]|uniref:tRNA preQ1(34) S-adenosylmethionine ribosyltransferase-isomerase QueA n=1 Tax=endosymbiont 'TC1' of Trimyema compressum TaxID=243899 RepID=UPI0007F1598D|nr:tRNA preQ1(34) S-adenosylmethionine ribosyltransferase-isomerase QueA [endosymbiont 'TC1' of Trimyema compressum]AMP20621.1 S-adenosylmethionine:tRNA ribosyltransferase-isomerase [endosymbiont 'TC1' of Trimyema compressum]